MKDRKREREKGSERGGDRVEGDGVVVVKEGEGKREVGGGASPGVPSLREEPVKVLKFKLGRELGVKSCGRC